MKMCWGSTVLIRWILKLQYRRFHLLKRASFTILSLMQWEEMSVTTPVVCCKLYWHIKWAITELEVTGSCLINIAAMWKYPIQTDCYKISIHTQTPFLNGCTMKWYLWNSLVLGVKLPSVDRRSGRKKCFYSHQCGLRDEVIQCKMLSPISLLWKPPFVLRGSSLFLQLGDKVGMDLVGMGAW